MVSACLVGEECKYNGGDNFCAELTEFLQNHEAIPVCPETAGGLSTPRSPCEIVNGIVMNADGENTDLAFRRGAEKCVRQAKEQEVDLAILQSRSPSCGVNQIYDGTFSGRLIKDSGVFASLLRENGVPVVDIEDLLRQIR